MLEYLREALVEKAILNTSVIIGFGGGCLTNGAFIMSRWRARQWAPQTVA